jgi:hypothetical protein
MIFPESFSPPAPTDPAARRPPSILLDLEAYVADRSNATTATATSNHGHTIQVSFWAADPPAMSYLCVHCPCAAKSKDSGFAREPRVVGAEGRFVLLRVRFTDGGHSDEYFMYRGDPESPSLEPVPLPRSNVNGVKEFGVVPRGDEGHYLIVDRCLGGFEFELRFYSSVDRTWSTKPLPDAPGITHTHVDKVITLGEGVLGLVDFRQGVLVCDVLREPSIDVSFIPLPSPMPENRERLKEFHPGDPAMRVRDVTFSNGVIKFIEVEHRWIVTTIFPEKPADPSETNVLRDSDLLTALKNKDVDDKPRQIRKRDGWRAVTWSRTLSSNCWHKGCVIDVDEIAVDDSIYSSLISGLGDDEHDKSLKFRNLWPGFPTLSTDVDDLVYLKSTVKPNDTDGWLVALDLAKKTLTAIGSYSFARHDPCIYAFRLCSLSNHLNMASGNCLSCLS